MISVDVVCIGSASAGVVCWEAEDIKVGRGTNHGLGSIIRLVRLWWEDGLDESSGDAYWMIGLVVQAAVQEFEYAGGDVRGRVEFVGAGRDDYSRVCISGEELLGLLLVL